MHLNELKALHVSQLLEMAAGLEIENANRLRKQELMFTIMKRRAKLGEQIFVLIFILGILLRVKFAHQKKVNATLL